MDTAMNNETAADREARKQRAKLVNAGARGADGLTEGERTLLSHLRRAGFELVAQQDYPRYVLPRGVDAWDWQALPASA